VTCGNALTTGNEDAQAVGAVNAHLSAISRLLFSNNSFESSLVIKDTTSTQQFNYSSSVTPVVDSISPVTGGSGTVITLTGYFPASSGSLELRISVGDKPCSVLIHNSTHAQCALGDNQAGLHLLSVQTAHGIATIRTGVVFDYQLTILALEPASGSFYGGSTVTISGDGFSMDARQNVVFVGGLHCNTWSSTHTNLECTISTQHYAQAAFSANSWQLENTFSSGATTVGSESSAPEATFVYQGCFRDRWG